MTIIRTETKTREAERPHFEPAQEASTAHHQEMIVAEPPQERSVLRDMADRYGMTPKSFQEVVVATCFRVKDGERQATPAEFAAFLLVAKEYNLNPITREIYAFRGKGGGIVPIVSVDGWANLINSQAVLDGIEFDDHIDEQNHLFAITCRIWRKDRSKPIVVTEYMEECKRATDTWKQWPRRMLRHKSLIQSARYAFGFSGLYDPDEAERMGADASAMRDVSPGGRQLTPPRPPAPPAPPARIATPPQPAARASDDGPIPTADIDEPYDPETGEILPGDDIAMDQLYEAVAGPQGSPPVMKAVSPSPTPPAPPKPPSAAARPGNGQGAADDDRVRRHGKTGADQAWLLACKTAYESAETLDQLTAAQKRLAEPEKWDRSEEAWQEQRAMATARWKRLSTGRLTTPDRKPGGE